MSLQVTVINKYRSLYPTDTLREISFKTQTQLTRVFRILNGAPMKLDEYERFQKCVENRANSTLTEKLILRIRQEANNLTESDLNRIFQFVEKTTYLSQLRSNETLNENHLYLA
jgi:hypothetical protein